MDIEVDPKLFITCRLCLENTGVYQITPVVQNNIKYCFDIDVQPFDGLPQLICKQCKVILNEYYNKKVTFFEKQKTLQLKLESKYNDATIVQPQQDAVSSSQQIDNLTTDKRPNRKRISSIACSTTSDVDSVKSDVNSIKSDVNSLKSDVNSFKSCSIVQECCDKTSLESWKTKYNKYFVCSFCQRHYRRKKDLFSHSNTHDTMLFKYHNILKKYCRVNLIKIDNHSNITGMAETVVYSKDKIIHDGSSIYYYIVYLLKESKDELNLISKSKTSINKSFIIDSSDDEIIPAPKRKRRCRLLSKSSNDTVVIGENIQSPISPHNETETNRDCKEVETNYTEYINIDDSSTDSLSYKSNTGNIESKSNSDIKQHENTKDDYKTIQSILSVCQKKYLKKIDSSDKIQNKKSVKLPHTESLLKHKILSMGRKIIHSKKSFGCTGLLRFMEHKNLEISWIPTNCADISKRTNYVRIMPKLRVGESGNGNNLKWKNILEIAQDYDSLDDCLINTSEFFVNKDSTSASHIITPPIAPAETQKPFLLKELLENTSDSIPKLAELLQNIETDVNSKNKLLNKNPVANPKQLPKRSIASDIKDKNTNTKEQSSLLITNQLQLPNLQSNQSTCINLDQEETKFCMPVITSTLSLATPSINESMKEKDNDIENNTKSSHVTNSCEKSAPRIKVKPVSELMSQRALHNLNQQPIVTPHNIWSVNQNNITNPLQSTLSSVYGNKTQHFQNDSQLVQNVQFPQDSTSRIELTLQNVTSVPQPVRIESVILDTVEMPNSRTVSPFTYFSKLLLFHNIILLDSSEKLSPDFKCLVKFKLVFQQASIDQSVVLCMSLFCLENQFCLNVKDTNQRNVCVDKISANWQWEILKACKGDVVPKLLQNAQKINSIVYKHSYAFICLLKSIKMKATDASC